MPDTSANPLVTDRIWAAGVGIVSGAVSAAIFRPLTETTSRLSWFPEELSGFLGIFVLSAGIVFGVLGAAFGLWRKVFGPLGGVTFFATSMAGIWAAVYAAVLTFDSASGSLANYYIPYLIGSPIGALIMIVPIALLARFQQPGKAIVLATLLPTIWSVGVAVVMNAFGSDAAIAFPWLHALFIGWQALFLMVMAGAGRRA